MKLTQINAQIVADSISPKGNRLTSLLITFPRFILAEVNTHRMLSKNTSSSRAVPFSKMVESINNDPFIPIAWQKRHSGMQGSEYFTDTEMPNSLEKDWFKNRWLEARDNAVNQATIFNNAGVTKQLTNRLLEPFMWTTMLITGSKEGWDNFFELRCPQYYYDLEDKCFKSKKEWLTYYKANCIGDPNSNFELDEMDWFNINKGQAEIHMMALAEAIYDAMNESTPNSLLPGEWHVPFANKINGNTIDELIGRKGEVFQNREYRNLYDLTRVKISTAMAARTSYTVVGDEKEINYKRMIELHDRLIAQDPPHSSPMEHCARAMSDEEYYSYHNGLVEGEFDSHPEIGSFFRILEGYKFMRDKRNGWCRNFKGFIPYRHLIENETI